jgi:invasion protein IalB
MTSLRSGLAALLTAFAIVSLAAPALAQQQPQNLGTFRFWTAWKGTDANGEMCYISSQPQKTEPGNVNRSPIHFLVIHRKGLGTKNEVQTLIGYPFNTTNSNASATIDGRTFSMVTEGEAAWLASAADEPNFVSALKAGSTLTVRGTSQRGTNTVDTYDLSGVTAAMTEIDKACA